MVPSNRKLYDYSPGMLGNKRTRQDVVSMFELATCVSDDCPACLPYIDSYCSDSPAPITIIYVEIDHVYVEYV